MRDQQLSDGFGVKFSGMLDLYFDIIFIVFCSC